MKRWLGIIIAAMLLLQDVSALEAYNNEQMKKIWETMPQRQQVVVNNMAANPFPNPAEGSSADYAIGMVTYALTNLYNNENLATCEEYLLHVNEKFNYRIPHTGDFKTYFQMTNMIRIWYLFSEKSLYYPGRLTKKAEDAILDYFMGFVETNSKVEDAKLYDKDIYYLQASGNHHVIKRCMYLLANQALMADDRYKDTKLADGYTVTEHYKAWEEYWKHDIVDRGKRALEVEYAANGYYKYTMDVFMTIHDFAQSSIIRDLAQKYLDVIFADIAIQTNNGLYGGARGRSTRYSDADTPIETYLFAKWFNIQSSWRIPGALDPFTGESMANQSDNGDRRVGSHPNQVSCVMGSYTPIQPIADLVLNYDQRGTYEYESNPPGRGETLPTTGWYSYEFPSRYVRYSYVTPDYILGAYTYDRGLIYNDVMGQNKQMGIHFTTPHKQRSALSRVFPESERSYDRGFFDLNGMGYKNVMLAQGLPEAKYYDPTIHSDILIGFTKDIYNTVVEEDGWMFGYVPDGTGYIAVKPSKGAIKGWKEYTPNKNVMGLHFTEKNVPIVLQAGSVSEFGSFERFKSEVKKTKMLWNSRTEFEYVGPGDVGSIKWYTDMRVPKIHDKTMDLEPKNMITSPFLNSVWGSGVYELKNKKGEAYTVKFEYDEADEVGITRMTPRGWVDDWNGIKLIVNGSFVSCEQAPVIENDRTLVPLRALFESLGAEVEWDGTSQTIHSTLDGDDISMQIGNDKANVNGKAATLDVAPQIINSRTMVPARFVAERFGAKVKWDEDNKIVVIWKGLNLT